MTSFRIFVLVAIIWGFTIGVGFIAGFAIGNRTDENEDKADSMPSRPDFERIRERIESGEIDAQIQFVFSNRDYGEGAGSDEFFDFVRRKQIPLIHYSFRKFLHDRGGRFDLGS